MRQQFLCVALVLCGAMGFAQSRTAATPGPGKGIGLSEEFKTKVHYAVLTILDVDESASPQEHALARVEAKRAVREVQMMVHSAPEQKLWSELHDMLAVTQLCLSESLADQDTCNQKRKEYLISIYAEIGVK